MKKDATVIMAARRAEKLAGDIRDIMTNYYDQDEPNSVVVLKYAGAFCSMASSILCELYEVQDSDFNIANANNVLREWGIDELVD